jgi:hypothetical protein
MTLVLFQSAILTVQCDYFEFVKIKYYRHLINYLELFSYIICIIISIKVILDNEEYA